MTPSALLVLAIPLLFPLAALLLSRLRGAVAAEALGPYERALAALLPTALLLPFLAPFVLALLVRVRLPRALGKSGGHRGRTISTTTALEAASCRRSAGAPPPSALPQPSRGGAGGGGGGGGGGGNGGDGGSGGLRQRRASRGQRGEGEPVAAGGQQRRRRPSNYGCDLPPDRGRLRASSSVVNPATVLAGAVLRRVTIVHAERVTATHAAPGGGAAEAAEAAATAAAEARAAAEGIPMSPPQLGGGSMGGRSTSADGGGGGAGRGGSSSKKEKAEKEFTAYCIDSVWDMAGGAGEATVRVWRRYRDFSRLCTSKTLAASFASQQARKRSKALFPGKRLFHNTAQSFVSHRRARLEVYLRGTFEGAPMPCGEARQFFTDGTAQQSALPKRE
jgi:hypothetical protein